MKALTINIVLGFWFLSLNAELISQTRFLWCDGCEAYYSSAFTKIPNPTRLRVRLLATQQNVTKNHEQVLDVSYCDLVKEPSKYHGKLIRTNAIFWAFMDSSTLYDLECNEKGYRVNPRLDCDTEDACTNLQDKLSLVSPGDIIKSCLNVVVIGVFYGPGDSDKRYGREMAFRFELAIRQIEQVKITKPNTPGPK